MKMGSEIGAAAKSEFIICVGSVGTGKSSTIERCLGVLGTRCRRDDDAVIIGSGEHSVTFEAEAFFAKNDALAFVDTRGWNDSSSASDKEVFLETLKFLKSRDLLRVKAIIWNVYPSVRQTHELEKQARFIDQFYPRKVWNNVVVVCKEARNPLEQSLGAVSLVRRLFNSEPAMQVIGFTYLDEQSTSLNEGQRAFARKDVEMRRLYNILTAREVGEAVMAAVARLKGPLDIELRRAKCEACGVVEDPRLMPGFCHMAKVSYHPGGVEMFHPGEVVWAHKGNTALMKIHPSEETYTPLMDALICGRPKTVRHSCCSRQFGMQGCKEVRAYECCKREVGCKGCSLLFECCQAEDSVTKYPGCRQRLRYFFIINK